MLLQASEAIQVGSGVVSLTTLILVLRLTFGAGQLVEKVDANEKRLEHLEAARCPHVECPLRLNYAQHPEVEHEG